MARPDGTRPRLVVKFHDGAQVRQEPNGSLVSLAGQNLDQTNEQVGLGAVAFEPVFKSTTLETLKALELKAATHSGKAQPDLAGIMYITAGNDRALIRAGQALLDQGLVEFVDWDWIDYRDGDSLANAPSFARNIGLVYTPSFVGGGSDTPDFEVNQDYKDLMTGGYDIAAVYNNGQILLDEGLTVPEWPGGNGGRGANLSVGIIDGSAFVNHEDLDVTLEPGQIMPPHDLPGLLGEYNHGTACLGIVGALDNGYGMTGLVPDCDLWFFPTISNTGSRLPEAFVNAYVLLKPGSIVSCSRGLADRPLIYSALNALLIQAGEDSGITTFISAGNDSNDLTGFALPESITTSDNIPCVVVGAGWHNIGGNLLDTMPCGGGSAPFGAFSRMGFTNFHMNNEAAGDAVTELVHVQSWGVQVATLGYGELYFGDSDFDRSYTDAFSGTSAASPLAAGIAASLQGISSAWFGSPLLPSQLRGLTTGNNFTQESTPDDVWVSHSPDPPDGDGFACTVNDNIQEDLPDSPGVPLEDSELIGGITHCVGALEALYTSNWWNVDSDLVGHGIIRGNHILGGLITLGNPDGVGIELRSVFTTPSDHPNVAPFPEAQYILYGQAVDVGFIGRVLPDNFPVLLLNVEYVTGILEGAPFGGMAGFEMYNWVTDRWDFINLGFIPSGVETIALAEISAPGRYIHPDSDQFMFRIWMFSFNIGLNTTSFEAIYDEINIDFTTGGIGGGS